MGNSSYLGLVHNAVLLLAMALIFDLTDRRWVRGRPALRQVPLGLLVGAIGIAIMMTPWVYSPGIVFDTRSVLLGVCGVFFGWVPTVIAMAMTAVFRCYQGGAATATGVSVILATGTMGIFWGNHRRQSLANLTCRELYLFGLASHLVMLALFFILPIHTALRVLAIITLPVLTIYPVGTALLGMLMVNRLHREQTTDALRDSEGRLQVAVEASGIGFFDYNLLTQEVRYSPEWKAQIGYAPEEVSDCYAEWESRIHPDDRQAAVARLGNCIAGLHTDYESEFRFRHKDGSYRWVLSRGLLQRDAAGNPVHLQGGHIDITKQKRSEDALIASERRFRGLAESSQDYITLFDRECRCEYTNPAALRVLGRPETDVVGRTLQEAGFDEDVNAIWEADIRGVFVKRSPTQRLVEWDKPEGKLYLDVLLSPVFGSDGDVEMVLSISRDITDRKIAELEIQAKNAELRAAVDELEVANQGLRDAYEILLATDNALSQDKAFIEALFDSIPGLLYVYDDRGNLIRWNKQHEEMTGYSAEELSHMTLDKLYEGEDWERVAAVVDEIVRTGFGEVEANLLIKGGKKVLLHANGVRLTIGGKTYFTGVGVDVTERKRAEEELAASEERYRTTVQNAPIGIFQSTVEGKFISVNDTLARMAGFASSEAMMAAISDIPIMLYRDPEQRSAAIRRAFDSRGFVCQEVTYVRPDGTPFLANLYIRVVRDADDLAIRLEGFVEDITEQRNAEDELRRSEERFRSIVESSPTGMYFYVLEPGDRLVLTGANPSADHLIGIDHATLVGKTLEEAFPRLVGTATPSMYKAVARGETGSQTFELDYADERFNGSYSVHVFQIGPNSIAVDWVDISARKRAEAALIESEQRLRFALEGANDGLWDMRQPQGTVYLSPRGCEILGYTPDELNEVARVWSDLVNPEDLPLTRERLQAHLDGRTAEFEVEQRLRTKPGGWKWVLTRGKVVERSESGEAVRVAGTYTDITERKRAEDALIEGEQRLRTLVDEAPFGAHMYELSGGQLIFLGANRAADRLLGVDHQQFVGRTIEQAFPPLASTDIPGIYRHVAETGERFQTDQVEYDDAGIKGAFEIHVFQTGENRMAVFFADITERKRAEEAIRESENRFRTIVASIPGAVYRCEIKAPWRMLYISDGIELLSGFPASEFVNNMRTYGDIIVPEDIEPISRIVDQAVKAHKPFQLEYRIRHRDGIIRSVFEQGCATYAEDGTPLWLEGVNLDISERKRMEDALRESEYFFKESQRAAFVGSYSMEFATALWESSEVLDQIFGIDQSYIRSIEGWLNIVHPDDRAMMESYLRDEVIGKHESFNKEYRIIRKSDGEVRWVFGLGKAGFDAEGNVISLMGTIQDITDRKEAEEALKEAAKAKDRFLALLSHELRNPLATMTNAVQLLKIVESSEPRLLRARDAIERAATVQARLLEDLLDVSRITLDRVVLKKAPVKLDVLVPSVVRSVAAQAAAKGIELTVDTEPGIIVLGDETRLEQVLYNLVVNAIKYTKEGSVWVTLHRDGAQAVLTIRDTGVGIAPDILPHVFEMFTQADNTLAHSGGGLGLGLSLVKSFVELHGGTVTAESPGPDRGAIFTVRLAGYEVSEPAEPSSAQAVAADAAPAGLRVLIVDDNVDARETLRDILELDRCIISEAGDGISALEIASREQPDVVLLDIGLPRMDGYEVARQLRSRPETSKMRIVAITGYGQEADRDRSRASGFDDHLAKPVDLDTLRAAIRG